MPTYQYSCTDCGTPLEVVQSFSDDALTECPACGGRLRKVFSAVGVVFKGSGFYRNDSRSGGSSNGSSNDSGNGTGGNGSSSTGSDTSSSSDSTASTSSTSSSSTSDSSASSSAPAKKSETSTSAA